MEHESNGVRLKITSKVLTAADIEARLGLKPDESWKIGETTGAFGVVLKDHGYAIDSTASLKAPISEHLRSVIKRIAPVAKQIGEVSTQATVEMICRVNSKAMPPLTFDRDDLRWLAAIGARLELDLHLIVERHTEPAKKP
jgi:hypothetical protein